MPFSSAFNRPGGGAGKRNIVLVAVHPGPAAAIHGGADHDLARLDALRQHRIDAVHRGVGGVRFRGRRIQRGLMPEFFRSKAP